MNIGVDDNKLLQLILIADTKQCTTYDLLTHLAEKDIKNWNEYLYCNAWNDFQLITGQKKFMKTIQ